ncbi:MAG: CBS domain-containing protein, partial [Anaerolineae bacterium]|nr:CBS domain-containing protein [Anaerolineae bacterium]
MKLILTHSNADFDAIAATMAAHKLYPDAIPVLPERLNRNVQHFMMLYRNGLNFTNEADIRPKDVDKVILVDTQRAPKIKGLRANTPQIIIDHHHPYKSKNDFVSEQVGAVTTLMVERLQREGIPINPLEATLMALGIYEDTGSLSYGTTTGRDIQAAAWLLERNAALDTVRRFLSPPLTDEQRALLETLLVETENQIIQGHSITVCAAKVDHYIEQIASVAHQLRDTLDSSAIFIAVEMPDNLLLVGRSTDDALDVGEVARFFGGGGHARAAAATIYEKSLEEVKKQLWRQIEAKIQPVTQVENLMSYSAQTVKADQHIKDVVQHLRRIGHEGFPVTADGKIIGLLTRREVDRAVEHGLGNLTIREIMTAGEVTLHPYDSVQALEQKMVESGWGQIPVVDDHDQLIGIVTRTDLIKHWANTHPAHAQEEHRFSIDRIEETLGTSVAQLVRVIAEHAQSSRLNLYLVGGVVRDLMLQRPNYDIDFVVEQSGIEFARSLHDSFGGDIHSFQPFGTAKWLITDEVVSNLKIDRDQLPKHIDFATARNEFYEHPTALPTVYRSSIKLDLQRRDFTINTLAIQLSPETASGQILDFCGGEADLQAGLIRVLHSLSFVDDPTRILRAMRFKRRLGFTIEARTAELISTALPMLRRITGERIRN